MTEKIKQSGNRTFVLNFKVTALEKEIIENYARQKQCTMSEYVREAVFYDMFLGGNVEAYKLMISGIANRAKGLFKRYNPISNEEAVVDTDKVLDKKNKHGSTVGAKKCKSKMKEKSLGGITSDRLINNLN